MGRVRNEALALTWKRRIAKQQLSDLSVAEFCEQECVSPKSFYAWRRRLREDDPKVEPRRERRASRLFVPVEFPASSTPADGVRIELPGGAVLILPADSSEGLMTTAIRAAIRAGSDEERPSC
jgi:hypothetical protein